MSSFHCIIQCIYSLTGSLFTFEVTYRYSEKARKELQERHGDAFHDWPQQGTPEYHSMLYFLDLHRHHGQLAPASRPPPLMASSKGNTTYYNRHDGMPHTTYMIYLVRQRMKE